jgi:hypothetical protein
VICSIHVLSGLMRPDFVNGDEESHFGSLQYAVSDVDNALQGVRQYRGGLGSKGLCDHPYKKIQKAS